MLIQLCQPVIPCQSEIVRALKSHALLNQFKSYKGEVEHEKKFY